MVQDTVVGPNARLDTENKKLGVMDLKQRVGQIRDAFSGAGGQRCSCKTTSMPL